MPPTGTGGAVDPGQAAAIEQQTRYNGTAGAPGAGGRPNAAYLSQQAQDVIKIKPEVMALLEGKYKDPEAAYNKMWQLDDAGRERLLTNPEEIGELKGGVDKQSVETKALSNLSLSFDHVKPEVRREVGGYEQGIAQDDARQQQEREQAMSQTPEARANDSLSNAMSISHHASI